MERRYVVAALAIIATFAGFSRGFQSLQQLSLQHGQRGQVMSGAQCNMLSSISHWVAKFKGQQHRSDPEEAQMLAEMNLPIAAVAGDGCRAGREAESDGGRDCDARSGTRAARCCESA